MQTTPAERLQALCGRMELFRQGRLAAPQPTEFVNNHIHTIYSFSPYSPTGAAYTAWASGLCTAGIMDHDSIAGAREFIEAGRRLGIGVTCGFECRVKTEGTPFEGRRTNSPDQNTIMYLTCHGVPHKNIEKAQEWLAPVRAARNVRNMRMAKAINGILCQTGITLDFEKDVLPLSQSASGGTVTERHLLYALAFRITGAMKKGAAAVAFLENSLDVQLAGKVRAALLDENLPDYEYILLGALKGGFVERFYVPAAEECYSLAEFVAFVHSIGAVAAYPYLGDVTDSVTGDKKAQSFEDGFLDELLPWLKQSGFDAVTYMPTRNTAAQLQRLTALCERYNLFQISGEDINTPQQSFVCAALARPEYRHLIAATWALIGHETLAEENVENGMFSGKTLASMPNLAARTEYYAKAGRDSVKSKV